MKRRLDEADAEMAEADWFDHVVMNPDGGEESAAAALVAHINAARHRSRRGAESGRDIAQRAVGPEPHPQAAPAPGWVHPGGLPAARMGGRRARRSRWDGGTGAAMRGESERVDRLMRTRGAQRRGPTHHAGSSQSRRRGKLRYLRHGRPGQRVGQVVGVIINVRRCDWLADRCSLTRELGDLSLDRGIREYRNIVQRPESMAANLVCRGSRRRHSR